MAVVAGTYWPQSLYCQMDNTDKCGRTLISRNGGSQSPDRWLQEGRNNHNPFLWYSVQLFVRTPLSLKEPGENPLAPDRPQYCAGDRLVGEVLNSICR